jgi:hypothetical protein
MTRRLDGDSNTSFTPLYAVIVMKKHGFQCPPFNLKC